MHASISWIREEVEEGVNVLYLTGVWRLSNLSAISDALRARGPGGSEPLVLDGSGLQDFDTAAGFALHQHLMGGDRNHAMIKMRGFNPRHERLVALVREHMSCPPVAARAVRLGLLERIGAATVSFWRLLQVHVAFFGAVAMELFKLFRKPVVFRRREAVSQFESICLDAIPIVCLMTFLIGVVFAYLLGLQAQRYGADIFVVDGVGLAVCRELSPLLVAVVVAGRSGAAFTAQIGTMKVQDEIDAISTLGLSPIQVLVIPRLAAVTIALPLLVFVGDLAGIGGGAVIAAGQLDITNVTFFDRLHTVLPMSAVVVGLVKAPVFAIFIAMIACRMGMLVARDARSVGVNTTSTVVQSIVWVILLDALFAVVFERLGI